MTLESMRSRSQPTDPVLLDLGNVLVHLRFDRGVSRLAALSRRPDPIPAARTFYGGAATLAFDEGRLDAAGFLAALGEALDTTHAPPEALAEAWCDIFDPWPEMEALAEALVDSGRPVYLLSNTDPLHFAHLRARMPVLGRLAGLHLSYEVGAVKPDPVFFARAVEAFGLAPGEARFVDDRPDNVAAAERLGIPSLLHTGDVEAVRRFLL